MSPPKSHQKGEPPRGEKIGKSHEQKPRKKHLLQATKNKFNQKKKVLEPYS